MFRKTIALCAAATVAAPVMLADAKAQDARAAPTLPARDVLRHEGAGLRSGHITSSGETVPNPGAPQASGASALDRGIAQDSDRIDSSICKGC